jgi:hypothetical protein
MKTSALLLVAFFFAFSACKNSQATQTNPVDVEPAAADCKAVEQGSLPKSDNVMSFTAEIKDGCLSINARYGGGCKEHEFRLFWNGMWAESMPPQSGLVLVHNANDDHCRSIKSSETSFDLSKLKYDGVNEVTLNIRAEGAEEAVHVSYKY